MASRTHDHLDLLVVGAGPTGLTAAVEARRRGLSVRVVERRERRSPFSKALVVHARTMEVFEGLGLAEPRDRALPASVTRRLAELRQDG